MSWPDPPGLLILFAAGAAVVVVAGAAAVYRGLRRPRRKTFATALANGLPTEPAELGLDGAEQVFTLADGSESPGWVMRGRRGDGPTVVIVHGFADSRYGALTWAPRVAAHASRVVVYDLRGHGDSTARSATCGVTDAADVWRVIEQVGPGSGGDDQVVLYGYSMGAGIAIAAAAMGNGQRGARQGEVVGVIADGPYRLWDEPVLRHLWNRGYPARPFVGLVGLALRWTVPGFGGFDRAAHAAKLPCPLLVLHGAGDRLCPLEAARAIAEASPRGEMVVFEEGGHLNLAEVEPERYRVAVEGLFEHASRADIIHRPPKGVENPP